MWIILVAWKQIQWKYHIVAYMFFCIFSLENFVITENECTKLTARKFLVKNDI